MSKGRRQARRWAVQFLFQRDFNQGEIMEALEEFWSDDKRQPSTQMKSFSEQLAYGVEDHVEELDRLIQKYAKNWDVRRMAAVDRNVMRVAVFEMLYRPDVPPVVSINEAVELVKELGSTESGSFVNGILDQICRNLDRPAREPVKPEPPKVILPQGRG